MVAVKSRVDIPAIREHYQESGNYDATARWASELFDVDITGSHVRYWLSKPVEKRQTILLFDIETAPMRVYTWGLFKQNIGINQIEQDWYVLCWAAKWLDKKGVISDALVDYDGYISGNDCEYYVVESLWQLLDEADIVVAHNGVNFDVKKMNAKFLEYGLPSPSHYRVVDTLRIARENFGFSSNKLDYIAQKFGHSGKDKTDFDLWLGCMNGVKSAWKKMVKYCKNDVKVLENVYNELKPWDKRHPQVLFTDKSTCNVCGSDDLVFESDYHTAASTFMIYRCADCTHIQRARKNVATDKEKVHRGVNV